MIKISDLVKRAKDTNSQELLTSVYTSEDYDVWVGIWLSETGEVDIFLAATIQLGFSEDCAIDLNMLTKAVDLVKMLHGRGYYIYHCGNGSIYVEYVSNKENVKKELEELFRILRIETSNITIIEN